MLKIRRSITAISLVLCLGLGCLLSRSVLAQSITLKDGVGHNSYTLNDGVPFYQIILEEHGKEYSDYYRVLRERIIQRLKNTYMGYYRNGDVDLYFVVNSNGSLKRIDVDVDRSTGDKRLVEMAILSIQQASPFPSFPKELDAPQLPFSLTVSFKETGD